MPALVEGYVLHTYGSERYVRHAVASVVTLRRHDPERPVALYCPPEHRAALEQHGLDTLFQVIEELPPDHRSIVGFKHYLHQFMPFDRSLYVDSDMVWCRNPDPLWTQLSRYGFTATGLDRADFFFGGPKGAGVFFDMILDRRRRTMRHFGLTHLPRVQAGMIYAQDSDLTREVCETASGFLARRAETHFRSRLDEGRNEESCEWSLALAMSSLQLDIVPWYQGYHTPQLDFIEDLTDYDPDFKHVSCRYYCDQFVYDIRGLGSRGVRNFLIRLFSKIPGRGDYMDITPHVLHFGWLHQKEPFQDFSARTWERLTKHRISVPVCESVADFAGKEDKAEHASG